MIGTGRGAWVAMLGVVLGVVLGCEPKPTGADPPANARVAKTAPPKTGASTGAGASDPAGDASTAGAPTGPTTPGGTTGAAPKLGRDMVAIPSPRPAGPVTAGYVCSHSSQPFGTGYFRASTYVDPVAGTITTSEVQGDSEDPSAEKTTDGTTTMTPAESAKATAAITAVLAGGPYRVTYPVSEGVVCRVVLEAGAERFFDIQRTAPVQDEVQALLDTFVPPDKRH
ncbi:MAG: hypothetical protein AAF721_38555 [Myxococcota bacterium]